MSQSLHEPQPPVELEPAAIIPRSMEIWISIVLRVGVMIAGATILVGLILSLIPSMDKGSGVSIHDLLDNGGARISVSPGSIVDGLRAFDPIAIIQLGLLILILTPIVRVAMTLVLFLKEADLIFATITGVVLIVLLLGFSGIV